MRRLPGRPSASSAEANALLAHGEFRQILLRDDALAHVYQAINAPRLEAAYRAARRDRRKFSDDDIPAVTQLFTPRWIVEFLIDHTLGLIPQTKRAIDIRILEPACGTMNFGLVAVDRLRKRYEDEIDHAGRSGWPREPSVKRVDEIGEAIARHNLFGIDVDPIALHLAQQAIEMKLGTAPLNLWRGDALRGFAEHDGTFDVVVTNPPFLSARNLPADTVKLLKRTYPTAWCDACTCFIERCLRFARPADGRAGLLVMQSFMFTGAFERFRAMITEQAAVETIAHFGGGVFDVGNPGTLQTCAVVLRREPDSLKRAAQRVVAYRLTDVDDKHGALARRENRFELAQSDLTSLPRGAWAYWTPPRVRQVLHKFTKLADLAPPRQGLATTDNARFVRFWWEVNHADAQRWRPYVKSGRFRRWYEAPRHRVDWANDGAAIKQSIVERYPYLNGNWSWVAKNAEYYGRPGVTYSYLTSGRFSARKLDAGAIFDVAGSALFPDDPLMLLAILNSSAARMLLGTINPTVNFQIGDLAQLPVPVTSDVQLKCDVEQLIALHRQLDQFDQTTTDFIEPMPWDAAEEMFRRIHRQIRAIGRRVDAGVADLYGMEVESNHEACPALERMELACRWVEFALRGMTHVRVFPPDRRAIAQLQDRIPAPVVDLLGGLDEFLDRHFFPWHARVHHRRPVWWLLGTPRRRFLVRHEHADARLLRSLLDEPLPRGWDRFIDDGIRVNLAPLHALVPDRPLARKLRQLWQEMLDRRFAWSRTAQQTCALNPAATDGSDLRLRPARGSSRARPVHAGRT